MSQIRASRSTLLAIKFHTCTLKKLSILKPSAKTIASWWKSSLCSSSVKHLEAGHLNLKIASYGNPFCHTTNSKSSTKLSTWRESIYLLLPKAKLWMAEPFHVYLWSFVIITMQQLLIYCNNHTIYGSRRQLCYYKSMAIKVKDFGFCVCG